MTLGYNKLMNRLFANIKEKSIAHIYRKGEDIFFEGEVPKHIHLIVDGAVGAYTITRNGTKNIANIFGKNSVIPITWANNQTDYAIFNYTALSDVHVLKITKDDFWRIINSSTASKDIYLNFLAKSQTSLMLRIEGLSQDTAIDKIAQLFYFLIYRYSVEKEKDIFEIDLKITQETIAGLTNQTRESVANNLRVLKQKGAINFKNSVYTVNRKKLDEFIDEYRFEVYELL